MKNVYACLVGAVVGLPLAMVCSLAVLAALAQEADNRAATRLRQQLQIDKMHMLKIPAINKKHKTEDCQLSDTEIRCVTHHGGELKIAVSN